MTARIEVLPTADDAARLAARLLVDHARAGHHVALAGGSTPRAAYAHAAEAGEDWSGAALWFGDDRAVPPGHEHSNYRMVHEALLERLPEERRPRVERVLGEHGADVAADDYDVRFQAGCPGLHLALMGLGPDAHTASLFPGDPALDERDRAAVAVREAPMDPRVPRVTLTLPVFDAAQQVVFLVAGADKRDAVRRAFGPQPDPAAPAARIRAADLLVLCDRAAAP